MLRDITMIVSVLISVVSVGFGAYESLQSRNNRVFAYEQVYRILNVVQNANITPFQKATIADAVLGNLTQPAPVIDLSRSSADVGTPDQICTETQKSVCTGLANDLAAANVSCAKKEQASCTLSDDIRRQIISQDCIACFTK